MRCLWLGALLGCALGEPAEGAPASAAGKETMMDDSCTVRVEPGQPLQAVLTEGAVVCLAPGVHQGGLRVEVSVDLLGEPGAVLDGGGRGPVVHVAANGVELRMRGLELRNGAAEFGSGMLVDAYAQVVLEDCGFSANAVGQGRGAAIGMARGRLVAKGLRTAVDNDLFFDVLAEVALDSPAVQGGMHVRDGAKVAVKGGQLAGPLTVAGTTTRRPSLVLEGVDAPAVDNSATVPGSVERR
jgi:hypothetical protein